MKKKMKISVCTVCCTHFFSTALKPSHYFGEKDEIMRFGSFSKIHTDKQSGMTKKTVKSFLDMQVILIKL